MSVIVTTEIFIKKAKEKHGDKFDYTSVNYISQKEKPFCKVDARPIKYKKFYKKCKRR